MPPLACNVVNMPLIAAILISLLSGVAWGAPPTTCGATGDYSKALCAYQKRDFAEAEAGFRAIVEKGEPEPQTIRAIYFLARTEMKTGRYEDAETLFIRIYTMSKAFYDEWNCDYLLGECRRARGKT
jgi:TolA-binding protein